jgi:SAM-dependent methyltransferase
VTISADELDAIRRTRRHPRPTQFDYLHVRRLVSDLRAALGQLDGAVTEALDVYCGSRPYEDLLPPGTRSTGLDVEGNPYGIADVVSNEFLPFADASFDLVTCYEAFHYVEDPGRGVGEIRRVLRPGGMALISVPFVWEYDRTILEHRYTGPELAALFEGWEDVRVVENGGRAVAWATLTGSILESARKRLPRVIRGVFPLLYVALNGLGAGLDALEQRSAGRTTALPMNLLVSARRPARD